MISNNKKKIIIIIPARLESKRLPNKVLKIIDGEPMIVKVAKKSKNFATDNDEPCPPSEGIIAFLNLAELKKFKS